ncbi:MAG: hypothetical protein HY674_04960 [Chloroflexi bacterium]|nr:hypothetical protein [Chloroflexota bacterium]
MRLRRMMKTGMVLTGLSLGLLPAPAFACAVCFGKSDSAMAQGMNMGIFSLLAVIFCVLVGIAGFFAYLAQRAARYAAIAGPTRIDQSTDQVLLDDSGDEQVDCCVAGRDRLPPGWPGRPFRLPGPQNRRCCGGDGGDSRGSNHKSDFRK